MRKWINGMLAVMLLAAASQALASIEPGVQEKASPGARVSSDPSAKDIDVDGIRNRKDACSNTPIGAKVDEVGCPVDKDSDSIADGIDRCGKTPAGWPVDEYGCPRDTDADGVVDGEDGCAYTPRGAKPDHRGCTTDADEDGVFDGLDRCASTPRGARIDTMGCPVDSDHDGIYDGFDQCLDTRHGARVDSAGCPEKAAQLFNYDSPTLVLDGVSFEKNKVDLTPESAAALDRVVASLRDWPELRVEIGGHTDGRGDAKANLDLSRRRAEFVRLFLVTQGIDESRLVAKGYGERKPIADNKTEEGRLQNRRVELTKLEATTVAAQ